MNYLRDSNQDGATSSNASPLLSLNVHNYAYLRLLKWDHASAPFPEVSPVCFVFFPSVFLPSIITRNYVPLSHFQTVLMDQVRFQEMQQEAERLVLLSSLLLIVYTTTGEAISGLPGLMERLKNTVNIMLTDMHTP